MCWSAVVLSTSLELHASARNRYGASFDPLAEEPAVCQRHRTSDFDKITDKVPNCVRTRLDEFLAGPGRRHGTKVYYLKPLCVEVGDQLIFTTQAELDATIENIRTEVFAQYRRQVLAHRARKWSLQAYDAALAASARNRQGTS